MALFLLSIFFFYVIVFSGKLNCPRFSFFLGWIVFFFFFFFSYVYSQCL